MEVLNARGKPNIVFFVKLGRKMLDYIINQVATKNVLWAFMFMDKLQSRKTDWTKNSLNTSTSTNLLHQRTIQKLNVEVYELQNETQKADAK